MSPYVQRIASYYLLAVYLAAAIGGGNWQYAANWLGSLGRTAAVQSIADAANGNQGDEHHQSHRHGHWHYHAPDFSWHVHAVESSSNAESDNKRLGTRASDELRVSDGWVHHPHGCPWLVWLASMRHGTGACDSHDRAEQHVSRFVRFESDSLIATAGFSVQPRGPPHAIRQA